MASRLNFSTGAIVNPLEGLQQSVATVGNMFDKYVQREQDREDRLAREAEDRRRYETQLGRYDRQEQESLRRYEEGKELNKLEREEARRRHDIQEARQAAADKRAEQLFNQQQQDRTKTKQEEVNRDALLYGYKDVAKDAVLDTKLGRAAVTKAEAPITYTEAIEARDIAEFGDFIPKSERIRTPYTREEIRPQVQEALLGRVDRDELAAAMVPRYRGTGLDPTEASKRLAAMNIGIDTEALQKQATENTRKMQEMVAKSVLGSDKQTTVNVNGGTQEKGLGFAPGEGTPDWYTGSWIADTNAEKLTQNRGKFIVDSGKSGFDAKDKLAEQRVMAELAAEGKVDSEGRIKVDMGPAEYKTRMQAALSRLSSEGVTGEESVRNKIKKLNSVYGITDAQGNPLDYIPSANVADNQARLVESTIDRLMQQYNTGTPARGTSTVAPQPQVRPASQEIDPIMKRAQEIVEKEKIDAERQKQLKLYQEASKALGINKNGVASPKGLSIIEQNQTEDDSNTVKALVAKGLPLDKATTAVAVAKVTGDNSRIDKILNAGPISAFDRGESGLNPREAALAFWKQEPAYKQYYRDALPVVADTLSRIGNAAGAVYDRHNVFQYARPSPEELKQYKDRLELEAKAKELAKRLPQ